MSRTVVAMLLATSIASTLGCASAQAAGFGLRPGTINSLNPQPLPPRWNSASIWSSRFAMAGGFKRPGPLNQLNPQPLPPLR